MMMMILDFEIKRSKVNSLMMHEWPSTQTAAVGTLLRFFQTIF